ncbi:MAG: hypothetical protein ABI606_04715 [Rhodoferax sp.]
MNLNALSDLLLSTGNPVLPQLALMRLALPVMWAIVLGSGVLLLAGRLARPYRLGLGVLVAVWVLLPGPASPAYWLGLAFQTPSLMTAAIGLGWFWDRERRAQGAGVMAAEPHGPALKILAATGIALGWVLLLDTLAWLPVSVYAWGFGSAAVGAVAVFATLLWAVWVPVRANGLAPRLVGPMLILCVLSLFVLTRLPSGNLWDALIDPWLWVALQLGWLFSAVRRLITVRRLSPAIRA